MFVTSILIVLLAAFAHAQQIKPAKFIAKRQVGGVDITAETFCGINPNLCGNGWCCYNWQTCITDDTGSPACLDTAGTDLGLPPFTIMAAQYSFITEALASEATALTEFSITASNVPTTIPGGTSALPTYSHSTTPSLPSDFTARDPPTATPTPTGGAGAGRADVSAVAWVWTVMAFVIRLI